MTLEQYDPNLQRLMAQNEDDLKNSEELFSKEDMVRMIKAYTEENIPEKIKNQEPYKSMWAILGKTPILTFLGQEDAPVFESLFRIAKLHYIKSKPAYKYTTKDQIMLTQLRIYFIAAIKRSIGHDKNKVNERTMEATSINQVVRSNTETFGQDQKAGVLGRFKGML